MAAVTVSWSSSIPNFAKRDFWAFSFSMKESKCCWLLHFLLLTPSQWELIGVVLQWFLVFLQKIFALQPSPCFCSFQTGKPIFFFFFLVLDLTNYLLSPWAEMFELKTDGRRSLSGEQFFLLKEGEVLVFATHTNMHLLAEATTNYVDGMFDICSISERASCNKSHYTIVGGSLR